MFNIDDVKKLFGLVEETNQKILNSKYTKIIKIINEDTKSYDPDFCKNKHLLYKIYSVILSPKQYIILSGNGGYGKTTTINAVLHSEKLSEYGIKFNNIINHRNFYDWTRIQNALVSSNSNFYIIDNFRELKTEDFYFVMDSLQEEKYKDKILLICRENHVKCQENDNFSVIDCNKYSYKFKDLKQILINLLSDNIDKIDKNNLNKMLDFIKKMPADSRNPFFVKLMANALIYHEKYNDIDEIFLQIKNLKKENKHNSKNFIYSLIKTLTGLTLKKNEKLLNELIYLDLILNETTFQTRDLEKILGNTVISNLTKEFCKYFDIFTKLNEKHYIHSIYSDFINETFENYSAKRKCDFFNDIKFKKIILKISHLLEMGKADPYNDKVKFLSYAHNIWNFCKKYMCADPDDNIFKNIDIEIKKIFIEFLNSYSFLLVKTYNNYWELKEAEEVQKQAVLLMALIEPQIYNPECIDKYYSSMSRYHNVFAKINLALALYSNLDSKQDCTKYFENAEKNLEAFAENLKHIDNDSRRLCRSEVLDYTKALADYKKSLNEIGIKKEIYINSALEEINNSESKSLKSLASFKISEDILNMGHLIDCLTNYDENAYYNIRMVLTSNKDSICEKLISNINAHIATLELKCIILFLIIYYNSKNEISSGSVKELYKTTQKIINFTYNSLVDDLMRQREILLLKIEFERLANGSSKNLHLIFNDKFKSLDTDDNRFKLMKNIILFLSKQFDDLNINEINECCLCYGIDKELFSQNVTGHEETLERILYKYLTM